MREVVGGIRNQPQHGLHRLPEFRRHHPPRVRSNAQVYPEAPQAEVRRAGELPADLAEPDWL